MKRKRKSTYNAHQRELIYAWRRNNPGKHEATVRKANRRRVEEAQETLAGSITEIKCVVPGCPAEPSMLQFHHIKGDGNKEKDRTQHSIARWIIKHDVLARKKVELRCRNHHRRADMALGLMYQPIHRSLTNEQIQEIRLVPKGTHGNTKTGHTKALAKKYGVSTKCIRYIRSFKTWKHLPWPEAK